MEKKHSNLFSWFSKPAEDVNIVKSRSNFNPTIELERQIGEQISYLDELCDESGIDLLITKRKI